MTLVRHLKRSTFQVLQAVLDGGGEDVKGVPYAECCQHPAQLEILHQHHHEVQGGSGCNKYKSVTLTGVTVSKVLSTKQWLWYPCRFLISPTFSDLWAGLSDFSSDSLSWRRRSTCSEKLRFSQGANTETQPLFWCQQAVWNYLMRHPVCFANSNHQMYSLILLWISLFCIPMSIFWTQHKRTIYKTSYFETDFFGRSSIRSFRTTTFGWVRFG